LEKEPKEKLEELGGGGGGEKKRKETGYAVVGCAGCHRNSTHHHDHLLPRHCTSKVLIGWLTFALLGSGA